MLRSLALLAVVGGLLVTTVIPLPTDDNTMFRLLMDAGHFPLFGCIALAIYLALAPLNLNVLARLIAAGIASGAIALGIEIVQPMVGRMAQRTDAITGGLGIACSLACVGAWQLRLHTALKIASVVFLVAGAAWTLRPVYHHVRTNQWAADNYPQLADFEDRRELGMWSTHGDASGRRPSISISAERATRGSHSLRVQTPGSGWNSIGFSIRRRDWSSAEALAVDVYVTEGLTRVGLDVTDTSGVKTKGWHDVKPGWNHIVITAEQLRAGRGGKPLTLSSVRYLTMWTSKKDPSHVYFVDNLRVIE